jgi:hypothetical protein
MQSNFQKNFNEHTPIRKKREIANMTVEELLSFDNALKN